jgi:D-alanyl-D-alanine carboxypeptidase/D-alanyl-D-alanine carboxypeptidase (penicillin-binding protein 5/6)
MLKYDWLQGPTKAFAANSKDKNVHTSGEHMKKLINNILYLLITAFLFLTLTVPVNADSVGIQDDETAYVLIDSKTGRILAEQNADVQIRPASLTKILTAIVALENGDMQQEMKVSQQAVYDIGKGGMNIGIMAGETGLTLENMLNVMLIKSANEAANIIAENLAESRKEYMDMMNQKAKELGAVNTYYVNPSGKDTEKEDADHFTTARDMAIMARYAMTIPEFRKIVATEYYEGMPVTNKHDKWDPLRNTNKFLWYDNTYSYNINGEEHEYTVIGMKTGYTAAAGNNLVIAATGEDGMELICVVMHVMHANKVYNYASELLRYGFENFAMKKITDAGVSVKSVIVEGANANDNILELITKSDLSVVMPIDGNSAGIQSKIEVKSGISAPVNKGDVLGNIEYSIDGNVIGKVDLTASRSISKAFEEDAAIAALGEEEPEMRYSYIILAILLSASGFLILRAVLRRISRRLKKKRYEQRYYR